MTSSIELFKMTRPQVDSRLAAGFKTIVATFGSTEQHGQHLPMGTDSIWGEEVGRRVAAQLGNALVVPGVRIGRSEHHLDFAGSLTYSEATFNGIVVDICTSMAHHGFKRIVLLPTHGGNFKPLGAAAELARAQLPDTEILVYDDLITFIDVLFEVAAHYGFSPEHTGAHAGENETSMILRLEPDLVDLEQAAAGFVGDFWSIADSFMQDGFRSVTENGVLGDPAGARADIGEAYIEAISTHFANHVRQQSAA
jgi:creatinine amidohydrolase